jgi:hypothetical protein
LTKLTFGQKACGVSFNPGGPAVVNEIKKDFATIVDNLHAIRLVTDNAEVKRMLSIAITEAQTAQMWAVKAVTWQF